MRGTFRLCFIAIAMMVKSSAPIVPHSPRVAIGGHSLSRYFITGQLNDALPAVTARNRKPVGTILGVVR